MFEEDVVKALQPHVSCEVTLEIPPDSNFGDFAFACFPLAKEWKKSPQEIAQTLAGQIETTDVIEKVVATGPYVNFFLNQAKVAENVLGIIAEKKEEYGTSPDRAETNMVEFFHANTHKGVHIGHMRTICLGSALANILEAYGITVIRANYQGDIGPHVSKCLWGYLNLGKKPPETKRGIWLGKIYTEATSKAQDNPEVEAEIVEITKKLYAGDEELTQLWQETRQWCLDDFEEFYEHFGVSFDELYFESEAEKVAQPIIQELIDKGIAEESEGAIIVNLEEYELGVVVLLTSERYALYYGKELGLAKIKFDKYTVNKSIHVVGSEQELFFKQVFKIFELMESPAANISHHLSYGLVMLPEGKMSSRTGTMVLYDDLSGKLFSLAEEGIRSRHEDWGEDHIKSTAEALAFSALKFGMISKEPRKNIVFDEKQWLDFEGETGPYIQYAYARICSIFAKAEVSKDVAIDSSVFSDDEFQLIKKLDEYPSIIESCVKHYDPTLLARYVLRLAQQVNEFYHKYPVLKSEDNVKHARLMLLSCVQTVLKNGLDLLGIEALEQM